MAVTFITSDEMRERLDVRIALERKAEKAKWEARLVDTMRTSQDAAAAVRSICLNCPFEFCALDDYDEDEPRARYPRCNHFERRMAFIEELARSRGIIVDETADALTEQDTTPATEETNPFND